MKDATSGRYGYSRTQIDSREVAYLSEKIEKHKGSEVVASVLEMERIAPGDLAVLVDELKQKLEMLQNFEERTTKSAIFKPNKKALSDLIKQVDGGFVRK